MSTNIISIQSQVVHGHVGNSAAVLPMQMRGLTVAAVPTTLLSNNPHFETMRGRVLESELVGDLLIGRASVHPQFRDDGLVYIVDFEIACH